MSPTGWRVLPKVLPLPQLKISERKIPLWVLSTMVLARLESLLQQLDRRIEVTQAKLTAPKGKVNWSVYANQRQFGYFVLQLLDWCESLRKKVRGVPAKSPNTLFFDQLKQARLQTDRLTEGMQAMDWTIHEKGLAGLGDFNGLPWQMSMESLFEAFIESIAGKYARITGARLRSGRLRETITAIRWDPPFLGSQKYLLPDFTFECPDKTIILDAKYKDHWEDLNIDR